MNRSSHKLLTHPFIELPPQRDNKLLCRATVNHLYLPLSITTALSDVADHSLPTEEMFTQVDGEHSSTDLELRPSSPAKGRSRDIASIEGPVLDNKTARLRIEVELEGTEPSKEGGSTTPDVIDGRPRGFLCELDKLRIEMGSQYSGAEFNHRVSEQYDEGFMHTHSLDSYSGYLEGTNLKLPKKMEFGITHFLANMLPVYHALFAIVLVANAIAFSAYVSSSTNWHTEPPLSVISTASATNLFVALLIRQDWIVNMLYNGVWKLPTSTPLFIRAIFARIYENGGIHSGCALASFLWFAALTGSLTLQVANHLLNKVAILVVAYALVLLLSCIIVTALPAFRSKHHNAFEYVHRWGGWVALVLFWVLILLFVNLRSPQTKGEYLLHLFNEPSFSFLLASTILTILPWFRLHKLQVRAERFSSHAVRLYFNESVRLFKGIRIARHPLADWHSFACIPSRDGGKSGGSVIISRAGDWTTQNIMDPQEYYWIKGIPVTGVLCIASLFNRVVIVTTGSGIGPCLGVMQDLPETFVRLVWSVRSPWSRYGEDVCKSVMQVDPFAAIIDTSVSPRVELMLLAYQIYVAAEAEAVLVISHKELTMEIVGNFRSLGIYSFGPNFDS